MKKEQFLFLIEIVFHITEKLMFKSYAEVYMTFKLNLYHCQLYVVE